MNKHLAWMMVSLMGATTVVGCGSDGGSPVEGDGMAGPAGGQSPAGFTPADEGAADAADDGATAPAGDGVPEPFMGPGLGASVELVHCELEGSQDVGFDEALSAGFSASEALALAAGEHTGTITWADGTETGYQLTITPDGEVANLLDYEPSEAQGEAPAPEAGADEGPTSLPPSATGCIDRVEIPVLLEWNTDDGRLAETLEVTLSAEQADLARVVQEIDMDAVQGTIEAQPSGDGPYDEINAFVNLAFQPDGMYGELFGQATSTTGEGEDGVAMAERFAIGSL